jgi:hypothetical protein
MAGAAARDEQEIVGHEWLILNYRGAAPYANLGVRRYRSISGLSQCITIETERMRTVATLRPVYHG